MSPSRTILLLQANPTNRAEARPQSPSLPGNAHSLRLWLASEDDATTRRRLLAGFPFHALEPGEGEPDDCEDNTFMDKTDNRRDSQLRMEDLDAISILKSCSKSSSRGRPGGLLKGGGVPGASPPHQAPPGGLEGGQAPAPRPRAGPGASPHRVGRRRGPGRRPSTCCSSTSRRSRRGCGRAGAAPVGLTPPRPPRCSTPAPGAPRGGAAAGKAAPGGRAGAAGRRRGGERGCCWGRRALAWGWGSRRPGRRGRSGRWTGSPTRSGGATSSFGSPRRGWPGTGSSTPSAWRGPGGSARPGSSS